MATPSPQDHFSAIANQYAAGRIRYPRALFEFLTSQCARRDIAWDCATGSGQAALDLAEHFSSVVATDISASLLALASERSNIIFRVGQAEESAFEPKSVDLITVAQALHWFDLPRFWVEVSRVLKESGVFAFWGYTWPVVHPDVDRVLEEFKILIASFWPERSSILHKRYSTVCPPFQEITTPAMSASALWKIDDYLAHLQSWSATRYFRERTGEDPVAMLETAFRSAWNFEYTEVEWPLSFRVFKVS